LKPSLVGTPIRPVKPAVVKPPVKLVKLPPPVKKPVVKVAALPKPNGPGGKKVPVEPPLTSQSVLKGPNPFYIARVQPKTVIVATATPSVVVPPLDIVRYVPRPTSVVNSGGGNPSSDPGATAAASPGRRVSGIMFNNGVYALLEQNGQTYTVQPGDMVEGDRVIAIEADAVLMKTANNVVVRVPLSDGDSGGSSAPAQSAPPMKGPPAGFRPPPGAY
jgi:hypothetical protein